MNEENRPALNTPFPIPSPFLCVLKKVRAQNLKDSHHMFEHDKLVRIALIYFNITPKLLNICIIL